MADVTSRMERFVNMIGGEENLPPKLKTEEPVKEQTATTESEKKTNPTSETKKTTNNWWEATPQLPVANPNQAPSAQPYMPSGQSFPADARRGQPAPMGISFSPFGAVVKFCYKFVKKDLQQPLATAFFDQSKIYNREWDL